MSQALIQKRIVLNRWKEEEMRFPIPKQKQPGPIPCVEYPGYFYIPWVDSRVVINRSGSMVKLLTGKEHPYHLNHKGYRRVALRIGNVYRIFPLHRIVAMLFCGIPQRHQGKGFEELEVNHKDGDITNNHWLNLEWVSGLENMRHAWQSGLIKTEKPVLAMDAATGEVHRFAGQSECAREFCLSNSSLSKHLRSTLAGRLIVQGHRFKMDDGKDWPDLLAIDHPDAQLGVMSDCIAENVVDGRKIVFRTLSSAARCLQLNLNVIRNTRTREGPETPVNGWIFYSLSGLPLSKKLKGQTS